MKIGSKITFHCTNCTVVYTIENIELSEAFEVLSIRFGTCNVNHNPVEVSFGLGTSYRADEIRQVIADHKKSGKKVEIGF